MSRIKLYILIPSLTPTSVATSGNSTSNWLVRDWRLEERVAQTESTRVVTSHRVIKQPHVQIVGGVVREENRSILGILSVLDHEEVFIPVQAGESHKAIVPFFLAPLIKVGCSILIIIFVILFLLIFFLLFLTIVIPIIVPIRSFRLGITCFIVVMIVVFVLFTSENVDINFNIIEYIYESENEFRRNYLPQLGWTQSLWSPSVKALVPYPYDWMNCRLLSYLQMAQHP